METKAYQNPLFYPPGGILLWIIIFLELITFGMGMLGLAYNVSFGPGMVSISSSGTNSW